MRTSHTSTSNTPSSGSSRKRTQQHGGGGAPTPEQPREFELVNSSLDGAAETHRLRFAGEPNDVDVVAQLGNAVLVDARALLERNEKNIKWYAGLRLVFRKAARPDVLTDPPVFFKTEPVASTSGNPLELQLKIALRRLWHQIDRYEANGSGWVIERFEAPELHIVEYDPLRAGAYVPLPKSVRAKRAILNIRNERDDDWYVYRAHDLLFNIFHSQLIVNCLSYTCF